MAKQFVEGNKYVFSAKKFKNQCRKDGISIKSITWHKSIDGRLVSPRNGLEGMWCNGLSIDRSWCKCIENNQGRL
ncbi:hypothetical protein [Clostridium botulinum]|uniref:hypothetical protein n=1 Tax=Clostridium botulinum TaxID=1491 RepID=UPI000A178441|nr:hypothetical protein [Clostridium botulinum]AUN10397.1 hypothetical protein RSJ6_07725 [Clostridium botulinum]OSA73550.1 hypothetical protein B2H87_05395 [Clostridium botulinum]